MIFVVEIIEIIEIIEILTLYILFFRFTNTNLILITTQIELKDDIKFAFDSNLFYSIYLFRIN